jgi:predicted dehydrogenase
MSRVRFIVVGLGARAQYWLRVLNASPDCSVVGLVDPAEPARQRALAQCPGARGSAELGEIISSVEADAVLLATPPGGRLDQIWQAAEAGLPILAEKPLADSVAEAARFVGMARAAGVPLMVGLNFRYLPVTRATLRLFRDEVGEPEFARFTYERWRDGRLPHLNKYPLTMAQPMLWEQSIHHFDLMRFVYGSEPVEIFAKTFNPSWSMYADDANVSALITFASGVTVSYQGTWAGNWGGELGFEWRNECALGITRQRDQFGRLSFARRADPAHTDVPLPPYEQWVDDAVALLADFVAALRGEHELHCSGADHLKSLRMVEACILSSETGRAINPADLETNAAERLSGRNVRRLQLEGKTT